ncbi:TetR/AcrR family transcriptional regulator [Streptomyces sp. B3I8]|uniref:TetR/AcrR family transcriptional regulator n=1 Tax=Streptomyces sp. B3I8 TaxID=3042303 RepID=UPI00278A55B1|nr:TetR/AcrR family transcriptional regulator [Streptomyces sp. B3I8]MDQ0789642.1 AcrR family transcriptional regulator [Streptomyces sp. B3I8]
MTASSWPEAPARTAPRRRGAVLERAILDAALDQLSTVGWRDFTMEGVAAGAQTGKAAVYRRWSSKEDLVVDALRAGLPSFQQAPNLGSVREDLIALCLRARDAMFSRSGFALRSVIHECDTVQVERLHVLICEKLLAPTTGLLREIVNRGIERGEVRASAANDYVYDTIPAMMMYRTKMCDSEWSERDVEELVDRLMLPLLRPDGA